MKKPATQHGALMLRAFSSVLIGDRQIVFWRNEKYDLYSKLNIFAKSNPMSAQ
ncbi:MAG: hypothetical protein LBF13_00785 [Campylobacteraceae bacterium]|jgi:hypothetical protein|nr:hypothetical protein [Campylobacteraceae bacterium]